MKQLRSITSRFIWLKMAFIIVIQAYFFIPIAVSEDLGFRYHARECVNSTGIRGLNPSFIGECGDLHSQDLTGADMAGLNLKGSHFDDADLSSAILDNVDAEGASFMGAHMAIVSARFGRFHYAIFESTNLIQANFHGSRGFNANFVRAMISKTDFTDCDFGFSSFSGARATGVIFTSVNLLNSDLRGIEASHAIFSNAILSGSLLQNAHLNLAIMNDSTMDSADFSGAQAPGAFLTGAVLRNTKLTGVNLQSAKLTRTLLDGVDLSGAILNESQLAAADLSNTTFENTEFVGAGFTMTTSLPFTLDEALNSKGMILIPRISSSGNTHSCNLDGGLHLRCWGSNNAGQLGVGDSLDRLSPTAVLLSESIIQFQASDLGHTCAVIESGKVYCWGINSSGQLGIDGIARTEMPMQLKSLDRIRISQITTGPSHGCAVSEGGRVYCWGNNQSFQLGTGDDVIRRIPEEIFSLNNARQVAAGSRHTCAVTTEGKVYCWGTGPTGQLGLGAGITVEKTPTVLSGFDSEVIQLAVKSTFSCALTKSGKVFCWGNGVSGQLGNGDNASRYVPTLVTNLPSIVKHIFTGGSHACADTEFGDLYCWGSNTTGQLGLGDGSPANYFIPILVNTLPSPVKYASLGINHTCAITSTDQTYCWGANTAGQLGIGSTQNQFSPTRVD